MPKISESKRNVPSSTEPPLARMPHPTGRLPSGPGIWRLAARTRESKVSGEKGAERLSLAFRERGNENFFFLVQSSSVLSLESDP